MAAYSTIDEYIAAFLEDVRLICKIVEYRVKETLERKQKKKKVSHG